MLAHKLHAVRIPPGAKEGGLVLLGISEATSPMDVYEDGFWRYATPRRWITY